MAVSDFVLKVSGTVAYNDNSHGSFESTVRWRGSLGGVVAQHSSVDSQLHFSQLYTDMAAGVNSMLALLPGTVTLSPPAAVPDKTVTSFVMELSGLVTDDSGTSGPFVVQWVNGTVDIYPSANDANWLALVSESTANSLLVQALEALAGVGNATAAP